MKEVPNRLQITGLAILTKLYYKLFHINGKKHIKLIIFSFTETDKNFD